MLNQLEERKSTFININNKTLATYSFVYKINDAYSVDNLNKFKSKSQLLFQKIEDKNQQLNLMFVDSAFANILADVALEVFLKGISSFSEYLNSKTKIKILEEKEEEQYFKYKFNHFIHLLLYTDISSSKVFNGEILTDRVYCFKNNIGELDYFTIYDQSKLQLKLFNELKLKIDFDHSTIEGGMVKLGVGVWG